MRKLIAVAFLLFASVALAATTSTSSTVFVNVGDPGWANFYFYTTPGTVIGSSVFIPQCHYGRGQFITNFDVYGQQRVSQFPLTCTQSETTENNFTVVHYVINDTPLSFYLANQNIDLTINSSHWQSTREGCGRSGSPCYKDGQGTTVIMVQ